MRNEVLISNSKKLAEISIDLNDKLEVLGKKSIANQLLRSGTSIGANINESIFAESIPDYIHKISIANKELSEFDYWINLCQSKKIIEIDEDVFDIVNHLQKTIAKLIFTSKREIERRLENSKKKKKDNL